jgi:hypothetical protein
VYREINEVIGEESANAALIMLPLPKLPSLSDLPTNNARQTAALNYMQQLRELTDTLPTTVLVGNGEARCIINLESLGP